MPAWNDTAKHAAGAVRADARDGSGLRYWLREPLLHFVLIGLALFLVYAMLNPELARRDERHRIELTEQDVVQLVAAWRAQGRAPPTPEQLRGLIDLRVREEVLVREALALGLDKNDAIVKRRLAQKMELLADDLPPPAEPTSAELERWYEQNAARVASGKAFSEVAADVKLEWFAEQRIAAKRKAFDAMRQRYEIVLPASVRGPAQ